MNLDASSLNIFCPEHNQYVQYVCLVNQCYQKLMCEVCLKKHRDVHRNMHTSLMEMINNYKKFSKIKLEDGEDLTNLHEQVKNGSRNLRGMDSKPSEIDYTIMQCLDGKDQEQKYSLFNEKAQAVKNQLTETSVKIFTGELELLIQLIQKKTLNFEKMMIESMQNQLKRATSKKVLEEKFLKESSISVILNDLKNNNDRYNQLNKNLQKFHKGFLELKVSKKIFRDMCVDTQQRFKIFTKNISSYFDSEYKKLFAFMIDTNEAINEQTAFEQQLYDEQSILSPSTDSPGKLPSSVLSPIHPPSKHMRIPDKNDPNVQMHKMIDDLKKINQDTRNATSKQVQYAPEIAIMQSNKVFNFAADAQEQSVIQEKLSQSAQQQQQDEEQLSLNSKTSSSHRQQQSVDFKNNILPIGVSLQSTPNKNKIQLNKITTYSPQTESSQFIKMNQSQFQQTFQEQNKDSFNQMQKQELLQRVNFTKKEFKMNLEKVEQLRFSIIQTQISDLYKQNTKLNAQKGTVSLKSLSFLYATPTLTALAAASSAPPPLAQKQSNGNNSASAHTTQSLTSSSSPNRKSVNFRITTNTFNSNTPSNGQKQQKFIDSELPESVSESNKQLMMMSRQLDQADRMMRRQSLENLENPSNVSQQQSINESTTCYEMSVSSDYKSTNVLQLSVNPYLRTYGFLEQLNIPFTNYTHPFRQTIANSKQQQSNKSQVKFQKKGSDIDSESQQIQLPSKQKEILLTRNESSYLISQNKENAAQQAIIGFEELSNCKFMTLHQNGSIQVWQLSLSNFTSAPTSINKLKEYNVGRYIYCYSEVNQNEDASQKFSYQQTPQQSGGGVIVNEYDPILMVCGQNEYNQTTLSIIRYELQKNKFSEIDSFRQYHGSGAISQIQVLADKQFKKKNVPNSLQLVTDVYYVFTLNLFDVNEEAEIDEAQPLNLPTIQVQKIQFHRDKHGSTEKSMIVKIKIQNNIIIQRILYDQDNDCLWGHSDYILFKWRINLLSKCLESQEMILLCSQPSDIITSMHCNNGIMMLSSLQGNIWGIDVMLNKVITTDFQRIKYSSINHYQKIQGKDPIYIISGAKVSLTPNNLRVNIKKSSSSNQSTNLNTFDEKNASSLNSTQNFNGTTSSMTSRAKEGVTIQQAANQQLVSLPKRSSYFLYSTLSSSGVKVFCFDADFKQVICTLSGQENHLQQFITLNKENIVLAVEDFNSIRLWKNEQI